MDEDRASNSDSPKKEEFPNIEEEIKKLNLLLQQKDNVIQLLEREKKILEKEKHALKTEADNSIKEKEVAVIRFASKEKDLLDAKREKEHLQKELNDAKKEIKTIKSFNASMNDEKTMLVSMVDQKCNELKKQEKSVEKLKADISNLEMKLKWNVIKLNQETECRQALEKKFGEVSTSTPKNNPKLAEQQRIEHEANLILLKHEIEEKDKAIENMKKNYHEMVEKVKTLEERNKHSPESKNHLKDEIPNSSDSQTTETDINSVLTKHDIEEKEKASAILKKDYQEAVEKIKTLNETFAAEVKLKNKHWTELNHVKEELNKVHYSLKQQRIEHEASLILLKHETDEKEKTIECLRKEYQHAIDKIKVLQENYGEEMKLKNKHWSELNQLKEEHNKVQNSLSQEILVSAQLRTELEASKILKAQHAISEERIKVLEESVEEQEKRIIDYEAQVAHLKTKEAELLGINKEMSEMIVDLQNQIYLQESKLKAIEAEKSLLQKERLEFDTRIKSVEDKLKDEIDKRTEERLALARHLSEKTKQHEAAKMKLENVLGDFEATKKKYTQICKELQRELNKYRKQSTEQTSQNCADDVSVCTVRSQNSTSSQENESQSNSPSPQNTVEGRTAQQPSKEHLVERILRLQQAAVRQTEKIDFLENHTMSLVAELQKKSKILQYYMLRDQAGALTSTKSDQNKTELAKYGGVMSAIYTGIRGNNQSMTLDLSLEINNKLQAVLEDTLLKNITLKENLDVLGLEVDKLTRQLAKTGANNKKYESSSEGGGPSRKTTIN